MWLFRDETQHPIALRTETIHEVLSNYCDEPTCRARCAIGKQRAGQYEGIDVPELLDVNCGLQLLAQTGFLESSHQAAPAHRGKPQSVRLEYVALGQKLKKLSQRPEFS